MTLTVTGPIFDNSYRTGQECDGDRITDVWREIDANVSLFADGIYAVWGPANGRSPLW